jgi:hypothetical protein
MRKMEVWQMLSLLLDSNTPVFHGQRLLPPARGERQNDLIHGCVLEEEGYALSIVCPPAGFGKLLMVSRGKR